MGGGGVGTRTVLAVAVQFFVNFSNQTKQIVRALRRFILQIANNSLQFSLEIQLGVKSAI